MRPVTATTLLDEKVDLCSERTMYCVLDSPAAVQERRAQRSHPEDKKPELLATVPNQVFNIGNEYEITMMELAERVKEKAGSSSEIVIASYDDTYGEGFEGMERRQPDATKIADLLGWETKYTIDDIINDVMGSYRPVRLQ